MDGSLSTDALQHNNDGYQQTINNNWTLNVVGFLDEDQNGYEKYILKKIS